MDELGAFIRRLRKEKGLTLTEVADACGISAAYLCDVELGRRRPSGKVLYRLADALGVSHGTLLCKAFESGRPVEPDVLPEKVRNEITKILAKV